MGLTAVGSLLSRVPLWAWAIAGLLAWGAWNGHRAKSVREAFDKAKIQAEVETARETGRRTARLQEITDAEIIRRRSAEATAARLRASEQRLRDSLAAAQAGGSPADTGGREAAPSDPGMLADVLGECIGRVRTLALEADATRAAGEACQQSYEALTPAK